MCWGSKGEKSDIEEVGLGMVVYFKILKAFTIIFFLITLLNVFLYYVYISNHKETRVVNYEDALFKTTIGNIGSSLYRCQKIATKQIFDDSKIDLNLDCTDYNISSITSFGMADSYDSENNNIMQCQNFTSFYNITTNAQCDFSNFLNGQLSSLCIDKHTCDIQLNLTDIKKNCKYSQKWNYFFFSYSCYDSQVHIGEYKVPRDKFSFIIVAIDCGSMLILLIGLIIIPISQTKNQKYFKENVIQISHFSLHFNNLGLKQERINHELSDFIIHLNNVFKNELPKEAGTEQLIYEFTHPILTDHKLDLVLDKNKTVERMNNYRKDLELNEQFYNTYKIERIRKQINKLHEREKQLEKEIEKSNMIELKTVNDAYVTFSKQHYKETIYKVYNRNKCKRCCLFCSCMGYRIRHL